MDSNVYFTNCCGFRFIGMNHSPEFEGLCRHCGGEWLGVCTKLPGTSKGFRIDKTGIHEVNLNQDEKVGFCFQSCEHPKAYFRIGDDFNIKFAHYPNALRRFFYWLCFGWRIKKL